MWTILINFGLKYLKPYLKELIIAAVVVACYLYVTGLQSTIEELTIENEIIVSNFENCASTLDSQNNRISFWEDIGKKQAAAMESTASRVKKLQDLVESQAVDILASDVKPATCEESIQYLIDTKAYLK